MLTFIRKTITTAFATLLLLVALFALFVGYRIIAATGQTEDFVRLRGKREYLEELTRMALPDGAPNIVFILYDDMG